MTLRRALVLAFVLLGWLPCVALSWLSFSRTREAMEAQIAQSLAVQASTLQAEIDNMLFERFQNALVWSRSELMQDLRLADVDKRVSAYLAGLVEGYGSVYRAMDCVNDEGRILASSSAARLGARAEALPAGAVSVQAALPGGLVSLALPRKTRLDDAGTMSIETPVLSAYGRLAGQAREVARLRLAFDPGQISHLLDRAAGQRRLIAVVDSQGRWIAGSSALRGSALPDDPSRSHSLDWTRLADGSVVRSGEPWLPEPVIAGIARPRAQAGWAGSGWTTVVLEPVGDALAPVHAMALIFTGLLGAVLLAILLAAPVLAATVARPIAALIGATRRYQRDGRLGVDGVPNSRIAELDELGLAYQEMMRSVERSRQELVRTSRQAMLGELAAVLAHEVRTPLGILRSSAQVLLRDKSLTADSRELMGFIESETERLNRLVSTMLETARPRQLQLAPCDLNELLTRCAQMQALQQQHAGGVPSARIEVDGLAADATVEADAEQLMQAVFNLLQNALQAAGPGGHVRLSTFDEGDRVRLECADDGPGIAPDIAERIFDPFFTQRDGGVGLGLAVVQQVIQLHGGLIHVGRSACGGAAFVFTLPRSQPVAGLDEGAP